MSDIKWSAKRTSNPAGPLGGTEILVVVQGGVSVGAIVEDIKTYVNAANDIRVDPACKFFGTTGVTVESTASFITGEPFIVRDDANSRWIMYLFKTVSGSPYVRCYYKTLAYTSTLSGTWSGTTELTDLAGYHKPTILVDVDGIPVVIGGNYHLYAVYYNDTLSSKEIFHFTCSTLTGTWTLGSKVIAKGELGSKDEFNTDTPFAVYDKGMIYMFYMGAPTSSLATYGLAIRMLSATATNPDGAFTKNYTDILLPDTTNGVWDYGWMGGVQIRRRPNGRFIMCYNAGNTRPSESGAEPNVSRIGYAFSDSITGTWTKDARNPYFSPTGVPSNAVESTNIWRGHLAYDHTQGFWSMFYNTGTGTEIITRADQGVYDYQYQPTGNVQTVTTSIATLTNSRVNLPAGTYRVTYQLNMFAEGTGALPKLDMNLLLRVNGTTYRSVREFVGSYAYENHDAVLNCIVTLPVAGYVDGAVQVTNGTPTANTFCRNLRVTVQQIKQII